MHDIIGEEDSIYEKVDIAKLQLTEAINLFVEKKYICSLTLAGPSEEIFAKLLNDMGLESGIEQTYSMIQSFGEVLGLSSELVSMSRKKMFNDMNRVKNATKHHSPGESTQLTFIDSDEAYSLIRRALYNASRLGVTIVNRQDFEEWAVANRKI